MADEYFFVGSGEVVFRILVDFFVGVYFVYMVLVGYWVEGGKGVECVA